MTFAMVFQVENILKWFTTPFSLLMLLELLLPLAELNPRQPVCSMNDPLPVLHEYSHPGDLVIGGVMSQMFYIGDLFSFVEHPKTKFLDIFV